MKYLAILGRQPNISLAELRALYGEVWQIAPALATFELDAPVNSDAVSLKDLSVEPNTVTREPAISDAPDINRLGGTIKLAEKIDGTVANFLSGIENKKIVFGISDYSAKASARATFNESLKLKKILTRHGHSVRVVSGKSAVLTTATSLHNGLSGKNPHKCELIKVNSDWYRVIGIQDIDAYTARDQARPARDARVGMLPPKLAQVLINLCGDLPRGSRILDPFCGTGVVLQEAFLMGYKPYGTDINPRMVEYTQKNLKWLSEDCIYRAEVGDATSFTWNQPIDAVACEAFLGTPMSSIPSDMVLKREKQNCAEIIMKFLKNLHGQIKPGTPVVVAVPAWLRGDQAYSRLLDLDLLENMGYNVSNTSREGLLYYRDDQIVARDIIIMRKK
ncbi:methyltransferase domain-containing protein [Candidatus Saccharibacteria bacterium]|nr:methyltransferase domain-containing protein [Candidatus Saccharibacteria bacterium]